MITCQLAPSSRCSSQHQVHAIPGIKLYRACLIVAVVILFTHGLFLYIVPFKSNNSLLTPILVLVVFQTIFFIFAKISLQWRREGVMPNEVTETKGGIWLDQLMTNKRLHLFLALVSLIGLVAHIWSKYYLVNIRPISCLFEIRFAWLEVNRALLPTYIRVLSVTGHLLTAFAYLGLMVTVYTAVRGHFIKVNTRIVFPLIFIFTMVGCFYSGFIGSRNTMLGFFIMAFTGLLLGLALSPGSLIKGLMSRAVLSAFALPLIVAVLFSALVFWDRIYCDKLTQPLQSSSTYVTNYYKEFDLSSREDTNHFDMIKACPICVSTIIYLNHGIYNLGKVMASDERGDALLIRPFYRIIQRIGLDSPWGFGSRVHRVFGPGGLPIAGAAYHDYGSSGLVVTAALLGILFGFSIRLMVTQGLCSAVGVWLFGIIFYVTSVSNIFVGFDILPFPFIFFGVGAGLIVGIIIVRVWGRETLVGKNFCN